MRVLLAGSLARIERMLQERGWLVDTQPAEGARYDVVIAEQPQNRVEPLLLVTPDIAADSLIGRLAALLGHSNLYHFGDLTIDVGRRRVQRGGRDMLLSQREFQFLLILAQEQGSVLPRSTLIDRWWRDDDQVGDNAVDALASRLRRRIDGPFGDKLIHTVRGVGYCLMAS
jgi:two-component system copper resistance phosphate regulon response regulator CusR